MTPGKDDQKPGLAETKQELFAKLGAWLGFGVVAWAVVLGLVWLTVTVFRSIF